MSDDGSDAQGVDTSQYTNLQALANTKGDPSAVASFHGVDTKTFEDKPAATPTPTPTPASS